MRAVIFALVASVGTAHAQPDGSTTAPQVPPVPMTPTDPPPAPGEADAPTESAPLAPPIEAPAPVPAAEPTVAPPTEDAPAAAAPRASRNKDAAWLFVGGALTFLTAGVVLAYSTSSSEQDLRDLYITAGSSPDQYDAETKERYDDLITEGERYEKLSWVAFGLTGASAIGATIFFLRASREDDVIVTPVVSPTTTGASVSFRF